MTTSRTIPYEPALDGLRGVSIVAVMAFHASATSGLGGWLRGGNLGVSVFFTLSGFLITSILVSEVDGTGSIDLGRFWSRRIRRLVPAALVTVTAVILLGTATDVITVRSSGAMAAVWSFTNWHVIAAGDDRLLETIVGPLGPTWSLAIEEQFYVVLAVVAWIAARSARPVLMLTTIFGAVVPISILLANTVSDWHPRLEFGTDVRAAEIAIGGLVALGWRRWGGRLANRAATADAAGFVGLAALLVLFQFADSTPPWLLRGGYSVVAVATASVIVGLLAHGRLAAMLGTRPLVAVGRISYSLYLVHWPLMLVCTPARVGANGWVLIGIKVAVSAAAALVLHHTVEQPIRQLTALRTRTTVGMWLGASLAVTALAAMFAT